MGYQHAENSAHEEGAQAADPQRRDRTHGLVCELRCEQADEGVGSGQAQGGPYPPQNKEP